VSLRFQTLKEKEDAMATDVPAEAPSGDHQKTTVDVKVMKIACENLTAPESHGAAKTIADVTPDDAGQEERAEV
jgi:hypothetical protein